MLLEPCTTRVFTRGCRQFSVKRFDGIHLGLSDCVKLFLIAVQSFAVLNARFSRDFLYPFSHCTILDVGPIYITCMIPVQRVR